MVFGCDALILDQIKHCAGCNDDDDDDDVDYDYDNDDDDDDDDDYYGI